MVSRQEPSALRIFVLSLPTASAHRAAIGRQLEDLGLSYEFCEAVDGKRLTPSQEGLVDRHARKYRRRSGARQPMTPGEIGCALTHALLYKKMVDEGIEDAIVLEDDALLLPGFSQLVRSGSLRCSGHSLIMLYHDKVHVLRSSRKPCFGSVDCYRPMERPPRTVAYYLDRAAAQRLLKSTFPISQVADWPCPIHRWRDCVLLHPPVVGHPAFEDCPPGSISAERKIMRKLLSAAPDTRPPRKRFLHRLLSLTLLPCVLWPHIYGDLTSLRRAIEVRVFQIRVKVWGKRLESSSS